MTTKQDQIIVIDLEATCWKKSPPQGQQREIIEVGVCVLNIKTLQPAQKRSILVKPTLSQVSTFCTKLTSLTQEQVDTGKTFAQACDILEKNYQTKNYPWLSWGDYDQRMFHHQCQTFGVPYPFSEKHLNLKPLYANLRHEGKYCGMARALKFEKLEMEGTHHRGHDDAWNTAKILAKLIKEDGQDILKEVWI